VNVPGAPGFPAARFPAHASRHGEGVAGIIALRQPPAALPAEQALLGALLANNRALDRVGEFLRAEHFADPVHARIFTAIVRRAEAGQIADVVTLRPEFENSGELDPVGGPAYLAQLLGAMVGIINAGQYGRLILDTWQRRELIALGEDLVNDAFSPAEGEAAAAIIERADAGLMLLGEGQAEAALLSAPAVASQVLAGMERALASKGGITGVTTGYAGLNRMTAGLQEGQLIVAAGRPSMGKTALALGVALRAAAAGESVLFASAEMKARGVLARGIGALAGVPVQGVLSGRVPTDDPERTRRLGQPEIDRVVAAAGLMDKLPLVFDESAGLTVEALRARARRMKRTQGLRLIVVDYLGKMRGGDELERSGNLYLKTTQIISGLQRLAMELSVPVLCLSQLNRSLESRDDPRPRMSDLRDSGAIEQDADGIWFLYREHYYLSRAIPKRRDKEKGEDFEARYAAWEIALANSIGRAEVDVAKQRQGPIGPVRMRFRDELTWFFDDAEGDGGPAVPGLFA